MTARILDAAYACIAEQGLDFSMQDVAGAAGMSRGILYRHFAGRADLIEAVFQRAVDELLATVGRRVDAQAGLVGQISEAITSGPDAPEAPMVAELDEALGPRVEWMTARWQEFWLPRLEDAQERGEVRRDLELPGAAEWIARIQLSLSTVPGPRMLGGDGDGLDRYLDELLIRGLGA